MENRYFKEYSRKLGRDMEFSVYGDAGLPVLMFPTMNGRFFQYNDFGLIDAASEFINSGRIQVITADGIDFEGITGDGDADDRIQRHEDFVSYVTKELVPRIHEIVGSKDRMLVAGCSMGGFHATNLFFRFPKLFDGLISLSGVFTLRDFFHNYDSPLLRRNCPLEYLEDMTFGDDDHLRYLRSRIVMCCGRGAYEERMLRDIDAMMHLVQKKKIPAFIDIWGYDVSHDWPWWHKQFCYFIDKVLT